MFESIFWGAVLRFAQAFIQATPTILVGLAVAGIFRRLLGHESTRRLFGCGTWREVPQAWLIGMLMPVCSLGVIPVAREMRRARIAGGAILAFAMTAPLFNPLSMLYGLTLSEPFVILSFAFCTMLVVTAVGWSGIGSSRASMHEEPAPPPVAYGVKRMAAIVVAAAREVAGPSLGYVLIALFGVVALSVALPHGSLMSTMEHKNPYAPLAMTAGGDPRLYAAAHGDVADRLDVPARQLGRGRVRPAHAGRGHQPRSDRLGLSQLRARPGFYLAGDPPDRRHLESPTRSRIRSTPTRSSRRGTPTRSTSTAGRSRLGTSHLPAAVLAKLKEDLQPVERVGMIVLASLFACRPDVACTRPPLAHRRLARALAGAVRPAGRPAQRTGPGPRPWDGRPGGTRGLQHRGVLRVLPFAARRSSRKCSILKAEVLTAASSGNQKHAAHFIPVWDDWTRKLQVGAFLREGTNSPYRRMKAKVFRDRLEFLKHAIEDDDKDEIREYSAAVQKAYSRMRKVYLGG